MIAWRIIVNPLTNPVTIGMSGPIDSLTSLAVAPSGDCLEGVIIAQAHVTPIKLRDAVQVQVSENDGLTWSSVYYGMCVSAPSAHSRDLGVFRFAGVKRAYYETFPQQLPPMPLYAGSIIPGGDVARMARAAAEAATLSIAAAQYDPDYFRELGFSLGPRSYGAQSFGDALDGLAEAVGSFIAPAGGHWYDLVFYPAGSVVPAATWGVNADGFVFFQRPTLTPPVLDEKTERHTVDWLDDNGEEAVKALRIVYAEQGPFTYERAWGGTLNLPHSDVNIPHHHDVSTGNIGGFFPTLRAPAFPRKLLVLDDPIDFMTPVTFTHFSQTPLVPGFENMFDGDDSTYAEPTAGSAVRLRYERPSLLVRILFDQMTEEATFTLRVRWSQQTGGDGPYRAVSKLLYLDAERGPLGLTDAVIPLLLPSDIDFTTFPASPALSLHVVMEFTPGIRVHRFVAYDADAQVANRLLGAHLRLPKDSVGTVTAKYLAPPAHHAILAPADGTADLTLDVQRIEYVITREDGLLTRYHAGQPFDSDLVSERVLLERLARQAAK